MKPITGVFGSILATTVIIGGLGFLAAQVPVSTAVAETVAAEENAAESGDEITGLEIIVTGIRNDKGRLIVAVFDKEKPFERYDYDRAIRYGEFPASLAVKGAIRISEPELNSGPYAISLYHDENNDYDFNMEGDWPLEGYGTSGARDAYHEPTFEEASVELGQVFVELFYL